MNEEETDEIFSTETGNPNDVIKEVFSDKNPKAKTDLTPQQISIISRLYFYSEFSKKKSNLHLNLNKLLDEFIVLRISRDRKSREEFVHAFQSADAMNRQGNAVGNVLRMFNGSR